MSDKQCSLTEEALKAQRGYRQFFYQVGGQRKIRCGQCVMNGLVAQTLMSVPCCCPSVQGLREARGDLVQPVAEEVGKEGMIAIPASLGIHSPLFETPHCT